MIVHHDELERWERTGQLDPIDRCLCGNCGLRLRWMVRRNKTKPGTSRHVWAWGVRVGYWPCLHAPFITVSLGTRAYDLWFGRASYRGGESA